MSSINSRLVELREMHNLSRIEMAAKLGVNRSTITRYETGNIRPDLDMLLKIKEMFGVSLDWLAGDDIRRVK